MGSIVGVCVDECDGEVDKVRIEGVNFVATDRHEEQAVFIQIYLCI